MFRPKNAEEITEVFALARREGLTVTLRGGGNSYGDAAINQEGIALDLTEMDRILAWDRDTGIVETEPGVTLQKLWQTIIPDGYWPPVVSGTMYTTVGGCAAMNIHGKNNFIAGPFGNHVLDFDLLTPSGDVLTCSREENPELFHAAISGFGMLGCFIRIRMQMKQVHSGLIRVETVRTHSLGEMADEFENRAVDADYLVGWVDCIAGGKSLGRGIVHQAKYLPPGLDPRPSDSLTVAAQELPSNFFGVVPKSLMYLALSPLVNNLGMRLINSAKYHGARLQPLGHTYFESHAGFAFLLDYVPNWKWAYKPGGLIQYQCFLPKEKAVAAFEKIIEASKRAGLPSYLGVFKKHRPDPFLMTHSLDGYSLALDYRITQKNRQSVWALTGAFDKIVLDNGGRFYFAKDATLRPDSISEFFPEENLQNFVALKDQCDPENLLQTDLSRRLFPDYFGSARE